MGPMLFQLSTFCLFSEILNTKGTKSLTHGERLHRICNIVLTEFFREFDKDRSILGRLLFWSRKGDVKSLQLEKRKEVELRQDQVGGEFGDSSEDEESDGDVLADVRRRLGRYKTKKRPWRKVSTVHSVFIHLSSSSLDYGTGGRRKIGSTLRPMARLA